MEQHSSLLPLKLSNNLQDFLIAVVFEEEVLFVIKQIPCNKAPGLVGYTVEIFRASWNTVRSQVVATIK